MKKSIFIYLTVVLITISIISCNKEESTPTGGTTTTGGVTTLTSNPNKTIAPNSWTCDSINSNISIDAQNISNVKLNLTNLEGIVAQNLKFTLVHSGIEVYVIDTLTASGTGNMTNTVLSDSGTTYISNGNYTYTGTFRPSHPLSSFINTDASGYWALRIYNSGTMRTGVIKSWGITLTYNVTFTTPSLTGAYLPMLGDMHKFQLCDTNNVQPGGSGANVTWDFSNLIVQPFEYTDEYVEPIISPMFWHFSQSNLAIRNYDLNGERFTFIRSEPYPGLYKFCGDADSNINGLKINEFLPPLTTFRTGPFTYGTVYIDSGRTHFEEPNITRWGLYKDTILGDGWGTILLPGGITHKNVLRSVITIAGIDTTNSTTVSYTMNKIYDWHIIGYKYPVLRIQIYFRNNVVTGPFGFKEVKFTTQNVPIN